jgi:hypothetical protein
MSFEDDYHAYLHSAAWKAKSRAMIEAAGLCERCHSRPAGNVHHLHYRGIGQELPGDLIVLCKGCHLYLHSIIDYDPAQHPQRFRVAACST